MWTKKFVPCKPGNQEGIRSGTLDICLADGGKGEHNTYLRELMAVEYGQTAKLRGERGA